MTSAVGFSCSSRSHDRRRLGEIALRHDERVGDRRLLQRLLVAQAVDGVDRRHDRLQLVVVPDDRLGEERVDDRAPDRRDRSSRRRRGGTAESRRARAGSSRSRSSSARSPRSVQQTQPERRSTVRSSTRRSRWWSMPTSPSSLTMTAVSPMSGWPSSLEMSVVLPLPRKPVTRVDGRLRQGSAQEVGIERVERPSRELLGLAPDRAQVLDHGGPARPVAEDVHAARPLVEPEAEVGRARGSGAAAGGPSPPVTRLLGPALVEQDAAEAAHLWSGFYQRTRRC